MTVLLSFPLDELDAMCIWVISQHSAVHCGRSSSILVPHPLIASSLPVLCESLNMVSDAPTERHWVRGRSHRAGCGLIRPTQ